MFLLLLSSEEIIFVLSLITFYKNSLLHVANKIENLKIYFLMILGIIVGFGSSLVRESASVMIGHYFKRRRQFVEMITMSGEGVGVALFSVILKEGVG